MGILLAKFKETLLSVVPVMTLVILLHLTVLPLPMDSFWRFLIGSMAIILGLTIFLFGVDIAVSPVGSGIGSALARKKNLGLLLLAGLVLGFFINIAEPDLFVLAEQISVATKAMLSTSEILIVVSLGIGFMVAIGLLRIVFQVQLRLMLFVIYGIILILSILAPNDFLGIAFDAGGATTGSMTVPFILAIGLGVSSVHGGKRGEEDAFGLVSIASGGPMLAVLIMVLVRNISGLSTEGGYVPEMTKGIIAPFLHEIGTVAVEVAVAISPLIILSILAQIFLLKLSKRTFSRILKGFVYTYLGFVLFLTGVTVGFMEAGQILGMEISEKPLAFVLLIAFLIGLLVILAEPSVHILTTQIEDITGGAIKRRLILLALALGVSLAILLSVWRLYLPWLEFWHLLLVLYLVALALTLKAPALFTGIAFDSGGVASGPMTATFVLSFVQGIAISQMGDVIVAFGTIAMVALTPLITLQLLGIVYHRREKRGERLG